MATPAVAALHAQSRPDLTSRARHALDSEMAEDLNPGEARPLTRWVGRTLDQLGAASSEPLPASMD